jgi:hypothetical protein
MSARMSVAMSVAVSVAMSAVMSGVLPAQEGTIVYRLGNDTVAVESFTRTSSKLTGAMVGRGGANVVLTTYDITLNKGQPTAAVVKRMAGDGQPIPNAPVEYRFAFRADSAIRETVWKDSTQRRAFAVANAWLSMPVFIHAPYELINALGKGKRDSIPSIGLTGTSIGYMGFDTVSGDTLRARGGFYPWLVRFDKDGRLQSVDGMLTTNKSIGLRAPGKAADVAAIAASMRPVGTLSPRQVAGTTISQAPIFISYGSPAVRGRSVWGGQLVPLDSVWRTGANEATHLATGKTLQLGDLTLAPGLYTLWTQHTRTGTWLIVNKQVGQWGTQYNAANDVGRVQMEMKDVSPEVENLTITVRPAGQGRGAIDIAWGDKVATAPFTVR